jgi:hypothetical protein
MKNVKSILMGTGSFLLAGLILTVFAPRAAHALVATLVQVTNTAASPVVTESASASNAFQSYITFSWSAGSTTATLPVAIPAGQRLVIEYISITTYGNGQFAPFVVLNPVLTGGAASSSALGFNPPVQMGAGVANFSQTTKIYADTLTLYAGSNAGVAGYGDMSISGYLVPTP